jgi:hypothetical protein
MPNKHSYRSYSALNMPITVRAKLIYVNYKLWFFLALIIILAIAAYSGLITIPFSVNTAQPTSTTSQSLNELFNNATFAGIFGAFVGVIGAGLFSFSVLKKQFEASSAIAKKDEIYVPIYNELKVIRPQMENDHGFPHILRLGSESFPHTFIWNGMKDDNRHLEIPSYISEILEKLIVMHEQYTNKLKIASVDISEKTNGMLSIRFDAKSSIMNLGTNILMHYKNSEYSRATLQQTIASSLIHIDDYQKFLESIRQRNTSNSQFQPRRVTLPTEQIEDLELMVRQDITQLESVTSLEKSQVELIKYTDNTISLFADIISRISEKYEIRKGIF